MESNVVQKMREALERTNKWISRLLESGNDDSDYRMIMGELANCKEINQSAIANSNFIGFEKLMERSGE